MKHRIKNRCSFRVLSFLLSLLFALSSFPAMAFASNATSETPLKIKAENGFGKAGAMIEVHVKISDNSGIANAKLSVDHDPALKLVGISEGAALASLDFTPPGKASGEEAYGVPSTYLWDSVSGESAENGTLLTLTFKIPADAEAGQQYTIDISCGKSDIANEELQPVSFEITDGKILVLNYTPGDVDDNGIINGTDVTYLRRSITGGYGVNIIESAADVNCDGIINGTDVTLLRRYITGGYGVVLQPAIDDIEHDLTAFQVKAPTCTEDGNIAYWYCSFCDKYFSDAEGKTEITKESIVIKASHTNETIPGYDATLDEEGKTDGIQCSVCKEWIQVQQIIPPNGHKITYKHTVYQTDSDGNITSTSVPDAYFNNLVDNGLVKINTPSVFSPTEKLYLSNDPVALGYDFHGWYLDGERVYSIPQGTTENIELTAHWSLHTYNITLYKNKNKVDSEKETYTVDKGYTLTPTEWDHYLFVAWTDSNGNVVSKVEPGTVGDLEFVANWTSERNQTIPEKNVADPVFIYEDQINAKYFFTYKIGKITNVPLYTIKDFGNTMGSGINVEYTDSTTGVVTQQQADSLSNMISNATTQSGSWTLSEEWNEKTSISEKHTSEVSKETISSATENRNTTGSWNLSKYNEGKDESVVGTESYAKVEASVNASMGAGPYKVEAGLSSAAGETTTTSESSMRYWNTDESYSSSYNNNTSTSFTDALKQSIITDIGSSQEKGHNVLNSSTTEVGQSTQSEREYISQLTISTGMTEASAMQFSSNDNTPRGYYRYVAAGTIHVYAVVGYDVATRTYFTYTYNVLDDEISGYLDYSTVSTYDDYQNGVLPFEVPIYVNEYLNEKLAESEGIKVNADGQVYEYVGSADENTVVIPDYHVVNNGDTTYSAIKVTGILSAAFQNNQNKANIETVILGKYITDIPNNTFAGYSNLKKVNDQSVGMIGDYAFKDCESLEKYVISEKITHLGVNAFEGVSEIEVHASSKAVAEAAVSSGANSILLDISPVLKQTDVDKRNNINLAVGAIETFELRGFRNEYQGLSIDSDAKTTIINGVTISDCTDTIPLKLNSDNVTLTSVNVNSTGITMLLKNENTSISLNGKVQLESANGNTVVAKNISLSASDYGELSVTGNVLVCDTLYNQQLLTSGTVKTITKDDFDDLCSVWVLASELPDGETVIDEKWTYKQIITSNNADVEGYELYDTTYEWSDWSEWSRNQVVESDSVKVETNTVEPIYKTQYNYSRYIGKSGVYTVAGPWEGTWSGIYCGTYEETGWSDNKLAYYGSEGSINKYGDNGMWFNETQRQTLVTEGYTEYRYCEKEYTYYLKTLNSIDSEIEVEPSETIVEVQKWVKYTIE